MAEPIKDRQGWLADPVDSTYLDHFVDNNMTGWINLEKGTMSIDTPNGPAESIDVKLSNWFKDWLKPTEAEQVLFELDFGTPCPDPAHFENARGWYEKY